MLLKWLTLHGSFEIHVVTLKKHVYLSIIPSLMNPQTPRLRLVATMTTKREILRFVAHHSSCSATVRTPHVTPLRPVFQFLEMLLDLHSLEKRVFSVERFQTSAKKTAFKDSCNTSFKHPKISWVIDLLCLFWTKMPQEYPFTIKKSFLFMSTTGGLMFFHPSNIRNQGHGGRVQPLRPNFGWRRLVAETRDGWIFVAHRPWMQPGRGPTWSSISRWESWRHCMPPVSVRCCDVWGRFHQKGIPPAWRSAHPTKKHGAGESLTLVH